MRKLYFSAVYVCTLAGCSQILGVGDYDIDPALDAKGGKGGSTIDAVGGEAGAPAGGQGGTKPEAGSSQGGKAGDGGDGGTPPAAGGEGGDGSGPPLGAFIGCDGEAFDGNEAIVRSCLLRVSCQSWQYPTDSISRCISQNMQNAYEGTKCTLDAQSCDDIAACEGAHLEFDFCDGKADGEYCNGNEIVYCGDFPYARDCAKYGGTCHDFGTELPSGHTVDCALPSVTTCTATTATEECGGPQNGYKYQCEGTIAYGTKCSNFAASCQAVGEDIGCYYPLNNCTTEGVACANDRATWCDGDSKVTYDCNSVGLGCSTQGDYYEDFGRQCSAPGCTPEDITTCTESCEGTKLTFCYGGAPVTVDCKGFGFDVCEEYDYDCAGGAMNDCLYTTDVIHFAECEYL